MLVIKQKTDAVQPSHLAEKELSLSERRAIRKAKEEKFQADMMAVNKQIVEVGDSGRQQGAYQGRRRSGQRISEGVFSFEAGVRLD